jgi:hypothetical protein
MTRRPGFQSTIEATYRLSLDDIEWLRRQSEKEVKPPSEIVRAALRMYREASMKEKTVAAL